MAVEGWPKWITSSGSNEHTSGSKEHTSASNGGVRWVKVVGEGGRCARCLCPSGACCVEEEVHKQVKPSRSIEHTFVAKKLGDGIVQISKCRRLRISPKGRSQTDPNCLQLGSQDSILLAIFAADADAALSDVPIPVTTFAIQPLSQRRAHDFSAESTSFH